MVSLPHQMDRCEVCGHKTLKIDLVRTNVDFLAAAGSNYFYNSSYNSSFWTVDTAVDAGLISMGPFADQSRVVIGDDNTLTESYGSQTWTGSGVLRSIVAVDASAAVSLVFAADIGPYQQETVPSTTFVFGLCDSDGSNKEQLSSWTVTGNQRAWYTLNIADVPAGKSSAALYFYVSVTAVGKKWWIDRIQLIKNAVSINSEAFVPTAGSAVDRVDTPMMTVRKVCQGCFEKPRVRSEQYNREAEQRTEDPVQVNIQEV